MWNGYLYSEMNVDFHKKKKKERKKKEIVCPEKTKMSSTKIKYVI